MAKETQVEGSGPLEITVVTPKGEVTHRAVDAITAYGELGEFGVLPGHVPFLTKLDPGVMVLEEGRNKTVYAHGSGFLEVGDRGVIKALVEQAALGADIDAKEAAAELEKAELEIKQLDSGSGADWATAAGRRDWAMAKLGAVARAR